MMVQKRFKVRVEQEVIVNLDEAEFTDKFFGEFNDAFFDFGTGSEALQSHAEHIAQLAARGILGDFIEGYGPAVDMGISAIPIVTEVEPA